MKNHEKSRKNSSAGPALRGLGGGAHELVDGLASVRANPVEDDVVAPRKARRAEFSDQNTTAKPEHQNPSIHCKILTYNCTAKSGTAVLQPKLVQPTL